MNRYRSRRNTLHAILTRFSVAIAVVVGLGMRTSLACVGTGCIELWSTADGGGALTVYWDFTKKVQTFESFCTPDKSTCLYSTIDPGFMAPDPPAPAAGLYRIADGTNVSLQIVMIDQGLALEVNGVKLAQPGDTTLLGTQSSAAPIHVHPSWQLVVPGGTFGDYSVSYKLTTDSPAYTDSAVYTQLVTNVPPPEMTPTPTSTPGTPTPAPACPGDCNADGMVTISELVRCVDLVLDPNGGTACAACAVNGGSVTVSDIIAAVNAALNGCPMAPPATLAAIQSQIFTPTCATQFCHDAQSHIANLNLTAGASYGQLVNVPSITNSNVLRVDPGHPESSFLLMKLTGPPPGEGSIMPLTGGPLSSDKIDLVRTWILQGAKP